MTVTNNEEKLIIIINVSISYYTGNIVWN